MSLHPRDEVCCFCARERAVCVCSVDEDTGEPDDSRHDAPEPDGSDGLPWLWVDVGGEG